MTATLAGMIAGPALVATIGYSFFGSCMSAFIPPEREYGPGLAAAVYALLGSIVWLSGVIGLFLSERRYILLPQWFYVLCHALWSGALTLALALLGIWAYTAC